MVALQLAAAETNKLLWKWRTKVMITTFQGRFCNTSVCTRKCNDIHLKFAGLHMNENIWHALLTFQSLEFLKLNKEIWRSVDIGVFGPTARCFVIGQVVKSSVSTYNVVCRFFCQFKPPPPAPFMWSTVRRTKWLFKGGSHCVHAYRGWRLN
jgi:hypothetical protein